MDENKEFFLDVDSLGAAQTPASDAPVQSDAAQDLVIYEKPKTTEEKEGAGTGRKLEDLYDEQTKLIFLFDTSGSMVQPIVDDDALDNYAWTRSAMKFIHQRIDECAAAVEAAERAQESEAFLDEEGEDNDGEDMPNVDPDVLRIANLKGASDDELKVFIVREGYTEYFGLSFSSVGNAKLKSKMEVVKEMGIGEIRKRITKYPEADIRVITFDYHPHTKGARTQDELVYSLNQMYPAGGTSIYRAVEAALKLCRKSPSPVNLHHIVLVSDAEDYTENVLEDFQAQMKDLGVVFDCIFISGSKNSNASGAAPLKTLAEATGGEFVVVARGKDLRQRFIAAAERKLLPPPASN